MKFCGLRGNDHRKNPLNFWEDQGTISLKHLGGKIAPKLVYFVLKKELLNVSEMAPWIIFWIWDSKEIAYHEINGGPQHGGHYDVE